MTNEQFIDNPQCWPHWPALPVVSLDGKARCAILFDDALPYKLYLGANIFGIGDIPGKTWGEKLTHFETKEYATAQELLAEWRID